MSSSRDNSKKLKSMFFTCDLFSKQISLFATRKNATNPRQYHGSWFGFVLSMVCSMILITYLGYQVTRMMEFKDDIYNSYTFQNTFKEGFN